MDQPNHFEYLHHLSKYLIEPEEMSVAEFLECAAPTDDMGGSSARVPRLSILSACMPEHRDRMTRFVELAVTHPLEAANILTQLAQKLTPVETGTNIRESPIETCAVVETGKQDAVINTSAPVHKKMKLDYSEFGGAPPDVSKDEMPTAVTKKPKSPRSGTKLSMWGNQLGPENAAICRLKPTDEGQPCKTRRFKHFSVCGEHRRTLLRRAGELPKWLVDEIESTGDSVESQRASSRGKKTSKTTSDQ